MSIATNGYLAAVLLEESRHRLLSAIKPAFPNHVPATHYMTIVVNPLTSVFDQEYKKYLGRRVQLDLIACVTDAKAQAVIVGRVHSDVPIDKKFPYIAISYTPEIIPKYIDGLVEERIFRGQFESIPLPLRLLILQTVITFIPFGVIPTPSQNEDNLGMAFR